MLDNMLFSPEQLRNVSQLYSDILEQIIVCEDDETAEELSDWLTELDKMSTVTFG